MSKYFYAESSKEALSSAHTDLQKLFNEVIKEIDCKIIYGHRTEEEQEHEFKLGHTKLHYPKSKHNLLPSNAVDAVPYPIDWGTINKPMREWTKEDWLKYYHAMIRFYHFAGIVRGIASKLNIKIRWGGDWDNDNDLKDQTWMDLPHYELID